MTNDQHKRLTRIDALTDRHMGQQVELGNLAGTLVGIVPCGDRVQLALVVGGARVFTSAFPGDVAVEVWKAAS